MFRRAVLLSLLLLFRRQLPADDPSSLQIRINEGDGQTYAIGSRATRGITLQIVDDAGKPVDGVTVAFRLPDSGPGGAFSNGSKTAIATTGPDGRASVWGMKWNSQPGAFDVRITATKGQARAGTVCAQHLAESTGPAIAKSSGGLNHKWLWIALAAGAAGAGTAIALRGHSSSASCSSTVVLPENPCSSSPSSTGITIIGQPTINLGAPQ